MIVAISILIIAAAIVGVLTYNGVFTDKDKDGIPDKVEEAFEDVKEDVKEAAKKVKKKVTRKTKKS
jgi:DNA-binding protein YbaB